MEKSLDLQEILKNHDLQVTQSTMDKEKDGIRYLWQAYGKAVRQMAAMQAIINKDYVQEFPLR